MTLMLLITSNQELLVGQNLVSLLDTSEQLDIEDPLLTIEF